MQSKSKKLLTVAVALAAALGLYLAATAPQPTDRQLIEAQLETARAAAAKRQASGIMSIISAEYHDSVHSNTDQLHARLIYGFRNSGPLEVDTDNTNLQITGDTAVSTSHLVVRGRSSGGTYFNSDVTLHWKREPARRLLLFPSSTWRVTGADFPSLSFGED